MAIVAGAEKVLVASASPSAASSVDITTGIDTTYDEYEVHVIGLRYSDDQVNSFVYLSTDGLVVPTYLSTGGGDIALSASTSGEGLKFYTQAFGGIWITYNTAPAYLIGNAAGESLSGVFRIYSPASTGIYRKQAGTFVYTTSQGFIKLGTHFVACDNTTDAVDSFRITTGAGTITGEVRVYGIVKSV